MMEQEAAAARTLRDMPASEIAKAARDLGLPLCWHPDSPPIETRALLEARSGSVSWSAQMPMTELLQRIDEPAGGGMPRASDGTPAVALAPLSRVLFKRGTVALCASETDPELDDPRQEPILGWTEVDGGRLRFNPGYLSQLADQLLFKKWPIYVSWEGDLTGSHTGRLVDGQHTGWKERGWHEIKLAAGLTLERATEVLWHEMAHAHQSEVFNSVHELRELVGDEWVEEDADTRWSGVRLPRVLSEGPRYGQ